MRYVNVVVATALVALACCGGGGNANSQQPDWSQHYRNATVSFGRVVNDGVKSEFQVLGTGIIVAPTKNQAFIVTARHIFDLPQLKWHPAEIQVRFAWEEGRSIEQDLGVALRLVDSDGRPLWSSLSDGSDVAAIPFNDLEARPPSSPSGSIDAIGFQDFAGADDIYDGASIFVYGFPGFVGPDKAVRAITRSGIVAWTDPVDANGRPFLIDSNIFPGNSGGPVFKVPSGLARNGAFVVGGRVALLGLVSENYNQSEPFLARAGGSNMTICSAPRR